MTPTLRFTIAVTSAALMLGGCTALRFPSLPAIGPDGGDVKLDSQVLDTPIYSTRLTQAVYSYDTDDNITLLLFNDTAVTSGEVLAVRLFWRPQAGSTPIDRTATNATMRYVLFEGDRQVGVYSGAGYMFLRHKPGPQKIALSIWDGSISLTDRTEGFTDMLGEARITGKVTAVRDDAAVARHLQQVGARVSQRLQYPRSVEAAHGPALAAGQIDH